jgi:MFS family permease
MSSAEAEPLESRWIGPIRLSPGVTPAQIAIFLVVVTITSLMFLFVGVIQPYLFSEIMHVPVADQGRLTGTLQVAQYVAVALFIVPAGSLSDHIGRRTVLIMAMAGFALTLFLLPLVSTIFAAILVRFMLGAASTGHTAGGATMMVDYPANASRGKFIALMLFIQGLAIAALGGWVLPRAPGWLIDLGFDRDAATRYALWSLAALGVAGILVAIVFLRSPPRPSKMAGQLGWTSIVASARQVLAQSRADPAFGMVVLIGFVIRSDAFVTLSFLSVWVMDASKVAGIEVEAALRTLGLLQIVHWVILATAPFVIGFVADRMNRINMLIGALVFSAAAFASTTLVRDVTGIGMIAVVAVIGVAENALTVASATAFGERAPPELRGSAMGFFVLMGTFSVILTSWLAGVLFDKIGFTAPFVFLSVLNLAFALGAVLLLARRRRRDHRAAQALLPTVAT